MRDDFKDCKNYFEKLVMALVKDEQGQSTVEYILMLAIVVMIAMKFKNVFSGKLMNIVDKLGTQIDSATNDTTGQ